MIGYVTILSTMSSEPFLTYLIQIGNIKSVRKRDKWNYCNKVNLRKYLFESLAENFQQCAALYMS